MHHSDYKTKSTKVISKLLSESIQFWLRSQVQQVNTLSLEIGATDPEIFKGMIPKVSIEAKAAVYKGLHVTYVQLLASKIGFTLSKLLRGKPISLLEPITVTGKVILHESDLNQSLGSELLGTAIKDFMIPLLKRVILADNWGSMELLDPVMNIDHSQLGLRAIALSDHGQKIPFSLTVNLELLSGQKLFFFSPHLVLPDDGIDSYLDNFDLDLGQDVNLQELTLKPGEIICQGSIIVNP